jgi:hypothetical protein
MEDMRNAYNILFRELEENRPGCGSFSKKIICEDVDWIHLARYRVPSWVIVNMVK